MMKETDYSAGNTAEQPLDELPLEKLWKVFHELPLGEPARKAIMKGIKSLENASTQADALRVIIKGKKKEEQDIKTPAVVTNINHTAIVFHEDTFQVLDDTVEMI